MSRQKHYMKRVKIIGFCQLMLALAVAQAAPTNGASGSGSGAGSNHVAAAERARVLLAPGADDWKMARLVSGILQQSHYSQQRFDDAVSSKFMDRYLDALDPAHMLFTQADERDFDQWRWKLDDLMLRSEDIAKVTLPAYVIFNRFMDRYEQQLVYVTNLLAAEKFTFTGTDRYVLNRHDVARPKDLTEAKQVWRDRTRYEYLLEHLNLARPLEIATLVQDRLNKKKPEDILKSIRVSKEKKAALKKKQEAESLTSTNETQTTNAEAKIWNDITSALKGKLSDEKADQITELVEQKLGKETPAAIAQVISAKIEKENAEEIVKLISRRYARQWRMLKEFDGDEVLQIYLTSLCHAYDPHSDYMGRPSLDNFNISMKLSLFGIGALLRSEDGYVKIQELMPGPAMKSKKVKNNDKIVAVAQGTNEPVDVIDMKLNKVVELIRGAKGTEVRLTIVPADAPDPSMRKVVALIRDEIKLEDQEAKAKIIDLPQDGGKTLRLGIIDLPSFYADMASRKPGRKSTTTDVGRLLTKLKAENVKGVILDLRRNGGGSLEEAISLTGLFIKEGPVVQVRDPGADGKITVDSDNDPEIAYEGPLVVLTSRFSASASEILAGALQDYGRALIVGDKSTHGKGTVQSLLELGAYVRPPTNNLGALKYTIRKFYRVSGSSTQLKGVIPDIILPSVNNHADVGEAALTNALPWDTIRKADFEAVNAIAPSLEELQKRSVARIAKDKDFAFIQDEIERYKKVKDEKSASLNEDERFKEKKENEARAEARKKEIKARGEPNFKTYDITLKLVDEPGLPAPTVKTNAVVVKATPKTDDDLEDEKDDTAPTIDPTLDETKRILQDLISLTEKSKSLAGAVK